MGIVFQTTLPCGLDLVYKNQISCGFFCYSDLIKSIWIQSVQTGSFSLAYLTNFKVFLICRLVLIYLGATGGMVILPTQVGRPNLYKSADRTGHSNTMWPFWGRLQKWQWNTPRYIDTSLHLRKTLKLVKSVRLNEELFQSIFKLRQIINFNKSNKHLIQSLVSCRHFVSSNVLPVIYSPQVLSLGDVFRCDSEFVSLQVCQLVSCACLRQWK